MKSVFHSNRRNIGIIVLAMMVVVVLLSAGCSSQKSDSAAPAAGSPPGAASVAPAGTAAPGAPAAGGSCLDTSGKASWAGDWISWAAMEVCDDYREYFYPANINNPDAWKEGLYGGQISLPLKFIQNGCDVTASTTIGEYSVGPPKGCQITFTGKVDGSGALKGTWKAYCNMDLGGGPPGDDSGTFALWMEPTGHSFIGTFRGDSPGITEHVAESCPTANSNWVGKKA